MLGILEYSFFTLPALPVVASDLTRDVPHPGANNLNGRCGVAESCATAR